MSIILASLLTISPQTVAGVIGLALVRSRLGNAFPKARLHSIVGFSLLLLAGLWQGISRTYIPVAYQPSELTSAFSKANFAAFVITTASFVFILLAIIADRKPQPASAAT